MQDQELLASVGVSAPIDELKQAIAERLEELSGLECLFEEDEVLDVRLRICDGTWEVLFGDVQFDTDYRGFCGSSVVVQDLDLEECFGVAEELLDQVLDLIGQSTQG
jgi:hypothetical protein